MANILTGKTLIFLGSSVTYGAASNGVSFADFICERNDSKMVKEAVSGTTLVDLSLDSYIARMKTIDEKKADFFMCQLSTNDATQKKPLGHISDSFDMACFNTEEVAGAIEYILAYATSTWHCPIMFYTNPKYDSEDYQKMVDLLLDIQKKWGFSIVDMWNDESFNAISKETYDSYMKDPIHPNRTGYEVWWTPYIEEKIIQFLERESS